MDVKTLCLGILTMRNASGYDIRQYFVDGPFGYFYQAGYGSIYPALTQATAEGLVTFRSKTQEGRPEKKIYAITPAGRMYLKEQLHKSPARDRMRSDYLVSFMFARLLEADHLEAIFDEYMKTFTDVSEILEGLDNRGITAGQAFVREMGKVSYAAVSEYLKENRDHFLSAVRAEKERFSTGEQS